MCAFGDVFERAVAFITVKTCLFSAVRQTKIIGTDIADICDIVAGHEQIEPTIIVEIKEPGGKTVNRIGYPGLSGYIGEFSPARSTSFPVTPGQEISCISQGEVKVWPAIVIVVAAGHAFDESDHRDPALGRHVGKRTVPVVPVQFAGVDVIAAGLVANKQIQQPVIIIIKPSGSLGGSKSKQPGSFGRVREGAIPVVLQE